MDTYKEMLKKSKSGVSGKKIGSNKVEKSAVTKNKKKVSKKVTSSLISKLNESNDLFEMTKLAHKATKQEKAFDNLSKHHESDKEKIENDKNVEQDIMKQLEMIEGIDI